MSLMRQAACNGFHTGAVMTFITAPHEGRNPAMMPTGAVSHASWPPAHDTALPLQLHAAGVGGGSESQASRLEVL
jgi:hypothetical protein